MSEKMITHKMGRRDFIKFVSVVSGGAVIAACTPQAAPSTGNATQAAGPTAAPPTKNKVLIKTTSQMAADQVTGFGASIKDTLDAKNIQLDITQTQINN
jgi:hypothetical protein